MPGVKVHGQPYTKGSMHCVGPRSVTCAGCGQPRTVIHQVVEDDKTGNATRWRAQLERAGAALLKAQGHTLDGPVKVTAVFVLDPPARNPEKRPYPHIRPDVDKLTRMLLDALTSAGVLGDDSRVVDLIVSKRYPGPGIPLDRAGVYAQVEPMPDPNQPVLEASR